MDERIAQVEIIVFKLIDNAPLFLLLKRIPEKGGFWQPITGGVNKNEDLEIAARRELFEETQIKDYVKFIKDVHFFEFGNEVNGFLKEFVFGVEVNEDSKVVLSREHTEKKWCTLEESLELLIYDSNKDAFKKLNNLIRGA